VSARGGGGTGEEGGVRGGRSGHVSDQVQRTPIGVEGEDGGTGSRGANGVGWGARERR
jgi:hypothetical protein